MPTSCLRVELSNQRRSSALVYYLWRLTKVQFKFKVLRGSYGKGYSWVAGNDSWHRAGCLWWPLPVIRCPCHLLQFERYGPGSWFSSLISHDWNIAAAASHLELDPVGHQLPSTHHLLWFVLTLEAWNVVPFPWLLNKLCRKHFSMVPVHKPKPEMLPLRSSRRQMKFRSLPSKAPSK